MRVEKIGRAELYHGDCMELMARYPDGHFDLAVVDPPYGVGSITYMPHTRESAVCGYVDTYNIVVATLSPKMGKRTEKLNVVYDDLSKNTGKQFGDFNTAPPPEYFKELFRVSKNQIIWGGNNFLLPPSRGFVVWDKQQSEDFSLSMCEYAWTSFDMISKMWRGKSNGCPGERIHPTQKPAALYKWLLSRYAKPGDKILDTHSGSGSIAVAANELGFDLTASELDAGYYEAACARVREAARQGLLFEGRDEG